MKPPSPPSAQSVQTPAMATTQPSRAPKRTQAHVPARPAKKAKHIVQAKKAATPERGTKTAKILDLLKRSGGASLDQLRKATGWQAHSVRGFLSGTLKKKMGLRVASNKLQAVSAPTASSPSNSAHAAATFLSPAAFLSFGLVQCV